VTEISKFWQDIELAYKQVSTNHEREIEVESDADGLIAHIKWVEHDFDPYVSIEIGKPFVGSDPKPELKVVS
jgi:hypothetical protein